MTMLAQLDSVPKPLFSDPRKSSLELHAHLRRLIIDNILPPGTVLKQTQVARAFAVSRTPVREAFRMLQEEGLIDADLNKRSRVSGLDPDELDQLYGARITLEALGARISTARLSPPEIRDAHGCLEAMEHARLIADMGTWIAVHRRFHALCMSRAGEPLLRTINSYSERSERYLRLFQLRHPAAFINAHHQHEGILDAVSGDNPARSGALMAAHLAHTALTVLDDVFPGSHAHTAHQALTMAGGRRGFRLERTNRPKNEDQPGAR